ncbi:TIR domain-containing protein [Heliobacillus mobilis]|uniref:TIR domain-containing protein n=1 Tax=Heliobacterium mobile TaxID=28064 RepID=A0A6I3SJ44_HELMO|nr:TIR domain-containing protein [Heliobacterium mobile]MTV48853.1 TIR domain-containing protein [Heliobacterium mobile]
MKKEYVYDAFISYRHTDLDIAVAKKLHRVLENYRIPRSIAKQTGIKKINRVFRDQEELPASGNLSENIQTALKNSRYLIVVCSPNTPMSKWCCQEIETFRSLHGNDRILSILIVGEPDDSFPHVLRFHNVVEQKPDGTYTETEKEVEPLAADIRGKDLNDMWKKLKVEKLRLLAPMLGVTFDDLKQRHREQFIKNIVGITLASSLFFAAFGGFSLFQSNVIAAQSLQLQRSNEEISQKNIELENINQKLKAQIEETYRQQKVAEANEKEAIEQRQKAEKQATIADRNAKMANEQTKIAREQRDQSQLNESAYLATLSKERFRNGDWVGAIKFALKGLPQNVLTPEKPYSEEADGALLGALYSDDKKRAIFDYPSETKEFSSNNKWVLTIDNLRNAYVSNVMNGEEILSWGNVYKAQFSPDGTKLLIVHWVEDGDWYKDLTRVVNIENGEEILNLNQDYTINSNPIAKYDPSGLRILTANKDGEVNLWDAQQGSKLLSFKHTSKEGLIAAEFSTDGKKILTISKSGIGKLWDSKYGKELHEFNLINSVCDSYNKACLNSPPDFIFNNNKIIMLNMSHETANVLDFFTGKLLYKLDGNAKFSSFDFEKDGDKILTTFPDGFPTLWDGQTGTRLKSFYSKGDIACISPDGKMVLKQCGKTGKFEILDAETEVVLMELDGDITSAKFNSDGSKFITSTKRTTTLWDFDKLKYTKRLNVQNGKFTSCQFISDGKRILTTTSDGMAEFWDVESSKKVIQMDFGKGTDILVNKSGNRIITKSKNGTVSSWDVNSGQEISKVQLKNAKGSILAISHDDGKIATEEKDNSISIWDMESGEKISELRGHFYGVITAEFSPNGQDIISGSYDNTARIWDVKTGEQLAKIEHRNDVRLVSYTQDGSIVLTKDFSKLRFWDAKTGKPLEEKTNLYNTNIYDHFRFGENKIASISDGHTLHIWDLTNDKELFTLNLQVVEAGESPGAIVGFSPDYKSVVTSGSQIWSLENGKQLSRIDNLDFISYSPSSSEILMYTKDRKSIIFVDLNVNRNIQNALDQLNVENLIPN